LSVKFDEFLNRSPSDAEIDELLAIVDEKLIDQLMKVSNAVTKKYWGNTVQCYYPGRLFPSISITGGECAMKCEHCSHHYLEGMIPAETPNKLIEVCTKLNKEGALGCLISGGFTADASLPFQKFIPALQEIKRKTKLTINIHTGFISEEMAKKLAAVGVDAVSVDLVGDDETIQKVYGLNKTAADYIAMLKLMKASGLKNIDPHICIGLRYGELKGEGNALKTIRDNDISSLTFIALNPTKGTPMQDVKAPSPRMIAKVIAVARLMMPKASISLGCMRPTGVIRAEADYMGILAGANRIVVPAQSSLKRLEKEYHFERHQTCCVI
jgi:uncharacterized radical SAM superfamily protein